MRRFSCDCGNVLFFGSTRCLACGIEVGFSPRRGNMEKLDSRGGLKRCANGIRYDICNWTTDGENADDLCISCRMNQMVPDLNRPQNIFLWARMESAKRRLIYTLLRLGIYIPTKKDDPQEGLAFEIASTLLNSSVTTGHLNGIITMNLEEADDTYRQINRQMLGETKRT
ncbi:MAG TPA: putative zinc-binding metallopeptidase, partial [Prosthecobacter sp.]